MPKDYFLGVHQKELERLERQHDAWKPETIQHFKDAGFDRCKHILDIGSGPGFTSFELVKQCPGVQVTALDKAALYQEYLTDQVAKSGHHNVIPMHADVLDLPHTEVLYDGAFCRWVLAFLIPDLTKVLTTIYNQLAPGGVFAPMEYLSLDTFTCSPPSKHFDAYREAWKNFYLTNGGDANIGTYLPQMLQDVGFKIRSIKSVGGHSPYGHRLYKWWRDAFDNFAPTFVRDGLMKQRDYDELQKYWTAQADNPHAYIYTTIISQIVAYK